MYGVKYGDLDVLRKQIGRDQPLARALWQTGNHDARIFATMIADPAAFDLATLRAWQAEANCNAQTDALITYTAVHAPGARAALAPWLDADAEPARRAGWVLASHLAKDDPELEDSFFAPLIARIERDLHAAPNHTREAMNGALIALGARSDALAALAIAAAHRLGPVTIDHGDTACKTPDAASYILKSREHRAKKAAKPRKTAAKKPPAKTIS